MRIPVVGNSIHNRIKILRSRMGTVIQEAQSGIMPVYDLYG